MASQAASFFVLDTLCSESIFWERRWGHYFRLCKWPCIVCKAVVKAFVGHLPVKFVHGCHQPFVGCLLWEVCARLSSPVGYLLWILRPALPGATPALPPMGVACHGLWPGLLVGHQKKQRACIYTWATRGSDGLETNKRAQEAESSEAAMRMQADAAAQRDLTRWGR